MTWDLSCVCVSRINDLSFEYIVIDGNSLMSLTLGIADQGHTIYKMQTVKSDISVLENDRNF